MSLADPWSLLGLEPTATDDEIRARYRELVKLYPPHQHAERSQRIRDAYDQVRDPRARARARLFGPQPLASLAELHDILANWRRPPAGPELWLEALSE